MDETLGFHAHRHHLPSVVADTGLFCPKRCLVSLSGPLTPLPGSRPFHVPAGCHAFLRILFHHSQTKLLSGTVESPAVRNRNSPSCPALFLHHKDHGRGIPSASHFRDGQLRCAGSDGTDFEQEARLRITKVTQETRIPSSDLHFNGQKDL